MRKGPAPTPLAERLARHAVRTPTGCLEWTRKRDDQGYGFIRVGPADGMKRRMMRVHRAAWIVHRGPIPAKLDVLHTCDNPPCMEPEHLFTGTNADNSADAVAKNRMHPKLTPEQRAAIIADRRPIRTVAAAFGVTHRSIVTIQQKAGVRPVRALR